MADEKKKEKRIAMEEREERRKHPFEATVTPEVLERGRHWIAVQLKNVLTERLVDVRATLYSYNTHDLDVLPGGSFYFVKDLPPPRHRSVQLPRPCEPHRMGLSARHGVPRRCSRELVLSLL